MKRIDTSTAVPNKNGAGKTGFQNGNLATGQQATAFNADWANNVQEEIANVVEAAGIVLDGDNQAQLLRAIRLLNNPGTVFYTARATPPLGSIKANGAAISRADFADLFAAIGTTYGAGDGSTTFNVPDGRAEFIRGLDDGRGIDIGRALGSFQKATLIGGFDDNADALNISYLANKAGIDYGADLVLSALYPGAIAKYSSVTTGTDASVTDGFYGAARPRNLAFLACIKY